MTQLSLFSADARPVRLGDLAGLLCGPATITRFGEGVTARLSIPAASLGRVGAVQRAVAALGIPLGPSGSSCTGPLLRSAYRRDLAGLARVWCDPARTKHVPPGFQLDGAMLRLWALAAGRPDGRGGFLFALDGEAAGTHDPLIAALTRLGLSPARVAVPPCAACRRLDEPLAEGVTPIARESERECGAAGPALRISGTRRIERLVELVGGPPAGVPATEWPKYWGGGRMRSAG